jgi:hypothetical protein
MAINKILSIIGLIIIAPFALVAAAAVLALIWVLLLFSIKIVFVIGGALFVLALFATGVTLLMDDYDNKTRGEKT